MFMIRAISDSMSENYPDRISFERIRLCDSGKESNASPTKRIALTKRQREIYEFLRDKIINRGYGPTVREIGHAIQYSFSQRCHVPSESAGAKGPDQPGAEYVPCDPVVGCSAEPFVGHLIGNAATGGPIQPSVASDESFLSARSSKGLRLPVCEWKETDFFHSISPAVISSL